MKNKGRRRKGSSYWAKILAVVFLLSTIAGAGFAAGCFGSNDVSPTTAQEVSKNNELTLEEKTEKILSGMSQAEKVGQLIMIGVHGTNMNDDIAYMLQEFHIGGVILFDRNMESQEQVKELNRQLQEQVASGLPLFIAVDEEGGLVARMKDKLPPPPAQRDVAMSGNLEEAKILAARTASSLKNIGFNVNFAPVADVGMDSAHRMYSDDADVVTKFVESAVQGYQSENMLCSLKHFPGIGKGDADSHHGFVNVSAAKDTLEAEDIKPFKYMIDNVDNDSYMVMVTHVTYSALDGNQPASMSPVIMKELLRNQLGYKGLIITDDMDMGAIANYYDYAQVGVDAIKAGADIVMVCHEYDHEIAVYNGILQAVQNGNISQEQLDDSVRKVIRAKLLHLV